MPHRAAPETLKLIGKAPIFRGISTADLTTIVESAYTVQVERRNFLFHQGEPATAFYVLLEGNMRLAQLTPEGKQVILHYFEPGAPIAVIVALADNATYPGSAEAMVNCSLLGWDRELIIQLMERYPRLAINGMKMISGRFMELQNRYRELATQRVERRIAHTILRLARKQNGRNAVPPHELILSQQDLAEMTGTTSFSVSRVCKNWETQGILEIGRGHLILLQQQKLAVIAEES